MPSYNGYSRPQMRYPDASVNGVDLKNQVVRTPEKKKNRKNSKSGSNLDPLINNPAGYTPDGMVTVTIDPKKLVTRVNKVKKFLIYQNGIENYTLINSLFIVLLCLSIFYNRYDKYNANTVMTCVIVYLTIAVIVSWYVSYRSFEMSDHKDQVDTAKMGYNIIRFMSWPFYLLFFVSAVSGILSGDSI